MKNIVIRLFLVLILLVQTHILFADFTEQYSGQIINLAYGASAWGDYDNDGDLDLLITGYDENSDAHSKIYENTGSSFVEVFQDELVKVGFSSVDWGDFDNDGDIDILITGQDDSYQQHSKIYENNGNGFTEYNSTNLIDVYHGDAKWGDFDNDGDLDIVLTGGTSSDRFSKIYKNDNGNFIEVYSGSLIEVSSSSVAWGDYDNDGDLDILLTGNAYSGKISKIYKNIGWGFEEIFAGELFGVSGGSGEWGDYDNDGDLDILLTGGGNTKIYKNLEYQFTEVFEGSLEKASSSKAKWGDYDNDGDLDILLSGIYWSYEFTDIYRNDLTNFNKIYNLNELFSGSAIWGDYDNDGDLDIFVNGLNKDFEKVSKLYKNSSSVLNTKPSTPNVLESKIENDKIILRWNKALDNETSQNGLSYNIYVYQVGSPNFSNPPHAINEPDPNNGKRLVAKIGDISGNSYPINVSGCGKAYYWSVQAVDASFLGSEFATEAYFYVSRPNVEEFKETTNVWGDSFTLNWYALTLCVTTYTIDIATDKDFNSILLEYNNKDIGDVNTYTVTGLNDDTQYFCRLNAFYGSEYSSRITTVKTKRFSQSSLYLKTNLYETFAQFEDYDSDGNLEILYTGMNHYPDTSAYFRILKTDNNEYAEDSETKFRYMWPEFIGCKDYDNDGLIDVIVSGQLTDYGNDYFTNIYKNYGYDFIEKSEPEIDKIIKSEIYWADYDNDGDLDIISTKKSEYDNPHTKMYLNTSSGYVEDLNNSIINIKNGDVDWGDYDNDGDLDILICGTNNSDENVTLIYQNNNAIFSEAFSGAIMGVANGTLNWFDYNNDGYLDVLVTGKNTDGNVVSKVYNNTGNGFNEVFIDDLEGVQYSASAIADYDNDGDLDILLQGRDKDYKALTQLYKNDESEFSKVYINQFSNFYKGSSDWGDYDNDGDLDFILAGYHNNDEYIKLYNNNTDKLNTHPNVPVVQNASVNGSNVTLLWDKTTDTETPQNGLTYNIEIYKKNDKSYKLYTKLERIQYPENGYTLKNLSDGEYTWKIQAFDTGLQGGGFSEEKTFSIGGGSVTSVDATICNGESYMFGTQELFEAGEYTEIFEAVDGSDSTVLLSLTVNPVYNLSETVSVCSGENYTYPDGTIQDNITSQVVHVSNLQTVFGCDSIIETTVNISSNPVYNLTETDAVCNNESYTFPDGTTQNNITTQVIYTSNLQTTLGCDSIIETTVNVNPIYDLSETVTITSGSDYTFPDETVQNNITTQVIHISNLKTVLGCDSIIETIVNVEEIQECYFSETVSVCSGSDYLFPDGTLQSNITSQIVHESVFYSSSGCDTVIETTVNVNPVYDLTESISVCSGSDYTFPDGTIENDITSQTVHTSNLQTIFGCDSIIETVVAAQGEDYNIIETVIICEGSDYTFPDGTIQYNISLPVVYSSSLTSVYGCDSIVETTVNLTPLPEIAFTYECDSVRVSFKNESLHSEFFIWEFGDGTNSFLKNPTHTYPELGEYTVRLLSNNDCGSRSIYETIEVIYTPPITGVKTVNNSEILVYPNPANDIIYIDYDKEVLVEFHNLIGTKVLESNKTEIDVSGLNNGTYIVLIKNNNGKLIQRVKIIKE